MIITSARLELRLLEKADAEAVYAYASDPAVSLNTSWPAHQRLENTLEFIDYTLGKHNETPGSLHLVWGIRLKPEPTTIGTVSFGQDNEAEGHIDYALARPHWGNGYATEAVKAAVDWAFQKLPQLERINSGCLSRNVGSVRVLEKVGFSVSERYRSRRGGKFGGQLLETTLFSLQRKEVAGK